MFFLKKKNIYRFNFLFKVIFNFIFTCICFPCFSRCLPVFYNLFLVGILAVVGEKERTCYLKISLITLVWNMYSGNYIYWSLWKSCKRHNQHIVQKEVGLNSAAGVHYSQGLYVVGWHATITMHRIDVDCNAGRVGRIPFYLCVFLATVAFHC